MGACPREKRKEPAIIQPIGQAQASLQRMAFCVAKLAKPAGLPAGAFLFPKILSQDLASILRINKRKLSLKNSILVNISLSIKATLEKVSSFTKLIRMICVILSFQIASNFCGLTFTKSALRFLSASPQIGIILVKKSAFNNWSYNRFKLSLRIRL